MTIGDLAQVPEPALVAAVGAAAGHQLHLLSRGVDDRPVVPEQDPKSIGHERTFAYDLHGRDACRAEIVRLADAVGQRLRDHRLAARTITLKVRFTDFRTITRATTGRPLSSGPSVARVATGLLDAIQLDEGVRLLGVSGGNLEPRAAADPELLRFDDEAGTDEAWDDASDAVDAIRRRFGSEAIGPASMTRGGRGLTRHATAPWGPQEPADPERPAR
jgi:DNA polymerase-4